ncbi:MAG: MipA/OmpV family protein, partial [Gammaproteobacteria bacterium]|nr:MipA/OmpV family protein [Gammaproteobacteria bacterium]
VRLNAGTANQIDVQVTVPDRDYALELGAEILSDGDWGQLQLAAFGDVSATHGGYEVSASYSYGMRQQRWYLEPSIGASYRSGKLNNYYWGVLPEESNPALPAYEAGAGINVEFRLMGSYQLTSNWTLSVVAEVERMNDAAAASPIVADDYVTGFFAGFGYRF